jgi:hypothetical protein
MNQYVWVQPHTAEPAWAAGGTYQVVRVVRFDVEKWQGVPLGRRSSQHGLPHDTFKVSSQRRRAARRTRRVRSAAGSRAGRLSPRPLTTASGYDRTLN